ncbi:hypothetical protein [Paenibacillus hamazuiensis]|uniref:hypothetical protein n=1 Tax=Paenibacillus hamazuiensis TaxID=2936508 RepID=UPI0020101D67|nr:hypothetical protein [Paenibacillus hamazuiensis]
MTYAVPEILTSSPAIRRHPANPVLEAKMVPYPTTLDFNAGVVKVADRFVTVFRNDWPYGGV